MLENLDTVIAFSVVMLLLSLMITALVQMVVSLTALRGKNLFWGVKRLLQQVDPKLGPHVEEIADKLLRHPAITHTRMSRAVAIRPEELVTLLRELADPDTAPKDDKKKLSDAARTALKTRLDALTPANAAQIEPQIESIAAELRRVFPQAAATVDTAVRQATAQGDALVQKVNLWFDTLMDRTSERFKLHTRYITVGMTALFVIALQVDSISIFQQISTNPEVRSQLVQSSGATLQQAEDVFAQTNSGKGQALASAALLKMSQATDPLGQKVKAACDETRKADAKGCSGGLLTRQDGEDWLRDHLAEEDLTGALKAYGQTFSDVAAQNIKDLGGSMEKLRGDLAQSQIRIFPDPAHPAPPARPLGLIASILLLSLGAPFWYNVLRKLSDLRPIVARNVEGEAPKALR